jgi:hypothetical protein
VMHIEVVVKLVVDLHFEVAVHVFRLSDHYHVVRGFDSGDKKRMELSGWQYRGWHGAWAGGQNGVLSQA